MKTVMSAVNGVIAFAIMAGIAVMVACTGDGRALAVMRGLQVAMCVAEHQDEPLPQVIARCAQDNVSPSDIERMLTEQKAATARAAARKTAAPATCPPPAPTSDGGK